MKHLIYTILASAMLIALTACQKEDNGPVIDESYTVTATKVRCDGVHTFQLDNVSGSKISTSAGDFYTYVWSNPVSPSGYPFVYGEDYTELTLSTSIPSVMQVVTTGVPDPAPIAIETIDNKTARVKYLESGCGYGAGYVLITGENGVSKLITIGVMEKVDADVEQYPTTLNYKIGDKAGAGTFKTKEDAAKSPIPVILGQTVDVLGIVHGYNPHYDVHNTVAEIEYMAPEKGEVSGCTLPVNLTEFKGLSLTPKDTGLVYIPIKGRKADGSYGKAEMQYIAFKVSGDK